MLRAYFFESGLKAMLALLRRMVMPRRRSSGVESRRRAVPKDLVGREGRRESEKDVLPWSMWARSVVRRCVAVVAGAAGGAALILRREKEG